MEKIITRVVIVHKSNVFTVYPNTCKSHQHKRCIQRQKQRHTKKQTTSTSTRNDNDSEGDIKTTLANNRFAKKKMCTYTERSETKGERNRTKQMKKKKNTSEKEQKNVQQMHSKS